LPGSFGRLVDRFQQPQGWPDSAKE